jgi:hypothetical protein
LQRIGQLALRYRSTGDRDHLGALADIILTTASRSVHKATVREVVEDLVHDAMCRPVPLDEESKDRPFGVNPQTLLVEWQRLMVFCVDWALIGVEKEQECGGELRQEFTAFLERMGQDATVTVYRDRFREYSECLLNGRGEEKLVRLGLAFGNHVGTVDERLFAAAVSCVGYIAELMGRVRSVTVVGD